MASVPLSTIIGGNRSTKLLYNRFTQAGFTAQSFSFTNSAVQSLSGALTANTLVDLINESGSAGQVDIFGILTNDVTARTMRVVIIVDGTTICDATSASITDNGVGAIYCGGYINSGGIYVGDPIKYTNSIRIRYASSLTETGKFTLGLAYQKVT